MSFKTIVEAIVAFFKAIFGGNKSTAVQQSNTYDKSKCMPEDVLDYLVNGHEGEERTKIRAYIRGQEAKGIYEYTFSTSRWYYKIKNGQIVGTSNNPEDLKINRI